MNGQKKATNGGKKGMWKMGKKCDRETWLKWPGLLSFGLVEMVGNWMRKWIGWWDK